jgi:hypothetical protein
MLTKPFAEDEQHDQLKSHTLGMLRTLHTDERNGAASYRVVGCLQPRDANLGALPEPRQQCLALVYEGDFDTRLHSVLTWAHANGATPPIKLLGIRGDELYIILSSEVRIENISAIEAIWRPLREVDRPHHWRVCFESEMSLLEGRSDFPNAQIAGELLEHILPAVERLWSPRATICDEVGVCLIDDLHDPYLHFKLQEALDGEAELTPLGTGHCLGYLPCPTSIDASIRECLTCGPKNSPSDALNQISQRMGHDSRLMTLYYLTAKLRGSTSDAQKGARSGDQSTASFPDDCWDLRLHAKSLPDTSEE